MDIKGLAARLRSEILTDGNATNDRDNKWPLPVLYAALISAEKDIARKLKLLHESMIPSICEISIASVEGVYPRSYKHSEYVLEVDRLKYPGVSKPLIQYTVKQLDALDAGWDDKIGVPTAFTLDYSKGYITFNRQPVLAGTVKMSVKRLPVTDQLSHARIADSELEVKQYDDEILHGAAKFAYLRDDLETFDPVRAGVWGKRFEEDIRQIQQDMASLNPQPMQMKPEFF